jgi:hypothetical protein
MSTGFTRCYATSVVLFMLVGEVWAGSPAAGRMELVLHATGAVIEDVSVRRAVNDSHGCALIGPAGGEQTVTVAYNKRPQDPLLQASDFAFNLSIAGKAGETWSELEPFGTMQVSVDRTVFVGLHAADADFRMRVTADSLGGTFSASHLSDPTGRTINVTGSWRCLLNDSTGEPAGETVAPVVVASQPITPADEPKSTPPAKRPTPSPAPEPGEAATASLAGAVEERAEASAKPNPTSPSKTAGAKHRSGHARHTAHGPPGPTRNASARGTSPES